MEVVITMTGIATATDQAQLWKIGAVTLAAYRT